MGTSTSPKVSTNPDTISWSCVELAPSTSPIDGRATFTFVMSRIVIAATETQTQNARQRAAGEIGMTAVVAGTARAVLVVFGDRRLRHLVQASPDHAARGGRGIRVPISLAGGALSTPFWDVLPRKRDMMGR